MAYCPNCGKEVSPLAAVCPNCGHPLGPQQSVVTTQSQNQSKLSSIKTYLLIALIFDVLAVIGFAIVATVFLFLIFIPFVGFFALFFIIPFILSVILLTRISAMRSAAEQADVAKLKGLNSVGWAIIALLFAGVITGIMLLIANGTINELTPQ